MKIEVKAKQTSWDDTVKAAISRGLTKASILMRNEAVKECPVDTGRLLTSITRESDDRKARIYTDVEYANAIEFGVKGAKSPIRQKGHPFMRPALYNNEKKIGEVINNEILKVAAKK